MSDEGTENRFRERRSAYVDAPGGGEAEAPEVPAAESEAPAAAEEAPVAATAGPTAPAAEPEAESTPKPAPPEEPRRGPEPEEDLDFEEMARLELPEPSFNEIVYEYAIRAQQFLGETPLTREGHRHVLPNYAKHMIDLLGILEDRTRGNLTPEEAQLLEQILADLRIQYVSHTS